MAETSILIVEDDTLEARNIKKSLQRLGYEVSAVVPSGEKALEKIAETHPDIVLMDIRLKGKMDGIEAAEQIRARFDMPVVYLTAHAEEGVLQRAKLTEPFGYILKPFSDRELHTNIEIALYKHKMEKKLRESEQWSVTTLSSIGDAVITTDTQSRITFMNLIAEKLTGWSQEEASGQELTQVFRIINGRTRQVIENPAAKALRENIIVPMGNDVLLITKHGVEISIDDSAAPIRDDNGNISGVVLIFHDIIERKQMEEQIKASLQEKEVLLKEIQHRVKNNLQVMSSLLYLQSLTVDNKQALDILQESMNRIRSMAIVHEQLYQAENLAEIACARYIQSIASHLFQAYKTSVSTVSLHVNVEDILLTVRKAIPCALIINELVTNALKYAFPAECAGEIRIDLSEKDDRVTLRISDNGVSIPEDQDVQHAGSLGLKLVRNLTTRQLRGTIDLDRTDGTTFTITFPKS